MRQPPQAPQQESSPTDNDRDYWLRYYVGQIAPAMIISKVTVSAIPNLAKNMAKDLLKALDA